MRRDLTKPERTLWALLRRDESGLHFRRQHPIGPYILDFYCAAAKLAVEVDGPSHDDQQVRDQRRTDWLATEGILVLRFTVDDVEHRPAVVLSAIARAAPVGGSFIPEAPNTPDVSSLRKQGTQVQTCAVVEWIPAFAGMTTL